MDYTERLSEKLAVVACIDPDAYTATTYASDNVDMKYHRRVMFIVQAGDLGASATIDFKVQASADGSTGWADLDGKAITQLTQAGTDDNKQAIVEVTAEGLPAGKRYLRGYLTVGTATSDAGVIALADVSRYEPGNAFDLDSVDEIVA
jgi:hypothetical protein